MRHQLTYRTNFMVKVVFTRNRSNGFGQAITSHHINTYRKNKFLYGRRDSCPSSWEESSSIQAQCLLQQAIDGLFVEFILHVQPHRRCQSLTYIVHIVFTSYLDGILHQCLLNACRFVYHFVYTGIYLFPETRHTTHGSWSYFLDSHLDILRTEIDVQFCSHAKTPATPGTFKHMGKRQEVDNHITLSQSWEAFAMGIHYRFITSMTQHHPFAFAGSTTGIKNVHQIFFLRFGCTLVHFCLMQTILAQCQEIIEING